MFYRRFGRTGIEIPVVTCGGMRYQHSWKDVPMEQIPAANQRNVEEIVQSAMRLGINHFETARGYGTSEKQLGTALRDFPREKFIVQTKASASADASKFAADFEKSLDDLQIEYVDLLAVHGINNAELLAGALRKNGPLSAARRLQREGRCRFIGFSTHASCPIIQQAIETGEFDYVNLHWYFVNEFNWPAIQTASQRGMGVFVISPTNKGGMFHHPSEKLARLCHPLAPIVFNDLYCLARNEVHTLAIGPANPSDFALHVAALRHYGQAADVVSPVEQRLRDEMKNILGENWCANWHTGLPSWTEVPGNINVREILRIWTYAKPLDLMEWGRSLYNLLGNGDHWFPGQNAAFFNEDEMRAVLCHHPLGDEIPNILREAHRMFYDKPVKRLSQQ